MFFKLNEFIPTYNTIHNIYLSDLFIDPFIIIFYTFISYLIFLGYSNNKLPEIKFSLVS